MINYRNEKAYFLEEIVSFAEFQKKGYGAAFLRCRRDRICEEF